MPRGAIVLIAIAGVILCVRCAHADPRARLEALLDRSGVAAVGAAGHTGAAVASPLKDTGDGGDTLFCLTFNRRDTRTMLRLRQGHAYVCFNFLQNPSEAVGNVLDGKGQQQCLITGFFEEGPTLDSDCLLLAFCGQVYVAGACF
jgi:hypothetical protein